MNEHIKRAAYSLLCLLLVLAPVLSAASENQDEPAYYVYALNSGENGLEREDFTPDTSSLDSMAESLIGRLVEAKNGVIGRPLLPAEVEINSYSVEGDVLNLDLSEAYLNMTRTREVLVRAGLVRTMVQIPEIRAVTLTVEGKPLTDSRGNIVGEMSGSTFVELSSTDTNAYRYDTFILYFASEDGSKLIPETRAVYYRRSLSRARVALEQLAKGPMEEGKRATIPEDVRLNSVILADDAGYVDFDEHFLEPVSAEMGETVPVASVVNTLIAATGVNKVQITVNGNDHESFGTETDLYNFFYWNEDIIDQEK